MKWVLVGFVLIALFLLPVSVSALEIVKQYQPQVTIVIAQDEYLDSQSPIYFAAQELQKYIGGMTGVTIPIKSDSDPSVSGSKVLVGESTYTQGLVTANELQQLGDSDGFIVKVAGNDLLLFGVEPRANLYAVYDFLEQDLDVRFFTPDTEYLFGEVLPLMDGIEVTTNINRIEIPDFKYRIKKISSGADIIDQESRVKIVDWAAKNKLNIMKFPTPYKKEVEAQGKDPLFEAEIDPDYNFLVYLLHEIKKRGLEIDKGGHGPGKFLRACKIVTENGTAGYMFNLHPEYYGMNANGVRCPTRHTDNFCTDISCTMFIETENPDGFNEYWNELKRWLEIQPDNFIFDIKMSDGSGWSQSPESLAAGTISDRFFRFVNRIADRIKNELPHKNITINLLVLYHGIFDTPTYSVQMQSNIKIIRLNQALVYNGGRSYKYSLNEAGDEEFNNPLRDKLTTWVAWSQNRNIENTKTDYYVRGNYGSIPMYLEEVILGDAKYYRDLGIEGVLMYGDLIDWGNYELNHYAHAKSQWDADITYQEFMDDYTSKKFGPVSHEIKKYFRELENITRTLRHPGRIYEDIERDVNFSLSLDEVKSLRDRTRDSALILQEALGNSELNEKQREEIRKLELVNRYLHNDIKLVKNLLVYKPEKVDELRCNIHLLKNCTVYTGLFRIGGNKVGVRQEPVPDNCECVQGDLNIDRMVDIQDLVIVTSEFGKKGEFDIRADLDNNGEIDIFDLVFIAGRFT